MQLNRKKGDLNEKIRNTRGIDLENTVNKKYSFSISPSKKPFLDFYLVLTKIFYCTSSCFSAEFLLRGVALT
jgi:hypothetical protein